MEKIEKNDIGLKFEKIEVWHENLKW
jgi:hypothetical protein